MESTKRESSIHDVTEQQDVYLLRKLVNAGGDVEQKEGCCTPLERAVLKDNLEMVDILLAAGAEVNTIRQVLFYEPFVNTGSLENTL